MFKKRKKVSVEIAATDAIVDIDVRPANPAALHLGQGGGNQGATQCLSVMPDFGGTYTVTATNAVYIDNHYPGILTTNTYITPTVYASPPGWQQFTINEGQSPLPCNDVWVQIEPARIRSVWLNHKPVRLAFPPLVFVETGLYQHQAFAVKEFDMYGWDTPLYQFPLTWHNADQFPRSGSVAGHSHIGLTGVVCYGSGPAGPLKDAFWNSNFSKYDTTFVEEWKARTEAEGSKAKWFAIREASAVGTLRAALKYAGKNAIDTEFKTGRYQI